MEIHEQPIINLLSFLHLQNPIGDYFLSANVPDTIFYENSIPKLWFFSKKAQVRMKSRMKLDDNYIRQYFLELNQEIVAIWRTKTELSVFNKESLTKFFQQQGQKDGILQRFVYPKGYFNCTIIIQWSQNQTLFEKFESKFLLNDKSIDIYQRALTHERDGTLAQQINSKSLTERLEHFSGAIAAHGNDLMKWKSKIIRMTLEIKIDNSGQIWLINCVLIKWSTQEQVHMKSLSLPSFIDQEKLILKQHKNIVKDSQCEMCDTLFHRNDLMKTYIKNIIESWNFDHMGDNDKLLITKKKQILLRKKTMAEKLDVRQDVELRQVNQNYLIPTLIRKIFPKLKYVQYKELLGNPGFLEMEFSVCYNCHVQIDKGVNVSQDLSKLAKQEMLCPATYRGIQKLRPEVLKDRLITTRREILRKIANHGHRIDDIAPVSTRIFNQTNSSRIIGISPIKSMITSILPKYSVITLDTKVNKNATTRTHSRRVSDLK
ncbi:unnamed protein product (macronuclear) [Paramecium tetraurelia]|uniref:Uncharacterized protein n=1 Tax=Paramecium tetraurelia TaxID=5888 RepID=A0DMC0_PARTE|nr:uncharacterized protein GSPATT00018405001 [Paramecium tetraurelia]CAK84187.1 unnamed protein product [Paramecium tetraurelia]|eukprot:XP_001451584.1 hypothetical protein (macronuclear) [Paramecium tetraurelia strain d4-2]